MGVRPRAGGRDPETAGTDRRPRRYKAPVSARDDARNGCYSHLTATRATAPQELLRKVVRRSPRNDPVGPKPTKRLRTAGPPSAPRPDPTATEAERPCRSC